MTAMMREVARLREDLRAARARATRPAGGRRPTANPAGYPADPVGFARDVLGVWLTPDQETILRHLLVPPCRVMVPSAHDTGKTFVAAVAVNWWYESYPESVVITTAPTRRDVVDLLWTEVRLQRQRAGLRADFIGPSAPEMRTSEDHYAKGYTAVKGESFQGRHRRRMLFVKDEANGVGPLYWVATRTMFDPELGHAELNIYNPTDTTSAAYAEENAVNPDGSPRYHVFRLSALNHPNVLADLRGEPRPVPGAVNLAMVNEWVRDWCEPVKDPADRRATDVQWPPEEYRDPAEPARWYRPGPVFQSRGLGLWPDSGAGVWSDALFEACLAGPRPPFPPDDPPEIGADMSTGKGEDYWSGVARWGTVALREHTSNTMDAVRIWAALKDLAAWAAEFANRHRPPAARPLKPLDVPMKLDDDGTGNAVAALLRRDGFAVALVGAAQAASNPERYPNHRSELWFQTADRARLGLVYLGDLDRETHRRLKRQLMAPAWDLDTAGRREVEPKDETKKKLGRSPDTADACNLAYFRARPGLFAEEDLRRACQGTAQPLFPGGVLPPTQPPDPGGKTR
jgi:hypothetical protein